MFIKLPRIAPSLVKLKPGNCPSEDKVCNATSFWLGQGQGAGASGSPSPLSRSTERPQHEQRLSSPGRGWEEQRRCSPPARATPPRGHGWGGHVFDPSG